MDSKDRIVGALKACTTKEIIEDTFARFDVSVLGERIDILNRCMGNPQTFFSSGDSISVENKYELTIQMFLTMSWKMNELYERMGIGC
jgi:hypothetical protein